MKPQKRPDGAAPNLGGVVASAGIGLAHLDAQGQHMFANERYYEMVGLSAQDVLGRPLGEIFVEADASLMDSVRDGRAFHTAQIVMSPRGGDGFPAAVWVNPIVRDKAFQGSVCTFADMTGFQRSDNAQHREMTHRMRNVFAIAQAIVGQTLRGGADPREAVQTVTQRLAALSNVSAALIRDRGNILAIKDVVRNVLAMHRFESARVAIDGPDLQIGSKTALAISLAIHELCTNARKYGAFSNDEGRVTMAWLVEKPAGREPTFHMTWREQFGPPVTEPGRRGFGSRLIVENLNSDVRGRSELTFPTAGALWMLECPLGATAD